ncbi:glycine cleavage system aminomethyltransferase GcvT [Labedella populi]|uniref:Aminomethyltransferase n=1 Tax=Labedella populi TaxID=2498850 RepID=A0A444QDF6_9MICO|nr:glycine cleavage system aminomethyltransferase GcvT [Labedella populi]RWZ64693.1 glycine cleavage system aminomethyltransferase GcvT [Labedella populi]
MPDLPRSSPLGDIHVALGAAFTDFAGWSMPVKYSSDLAEHHAIRNAAGIFDISHMGEIAVRGLRAGEFLDATLAGRLSALDLMQAKYTLLLNERGGVVDDLIVYRNGEAEYLVVANASNRDVVAEVLRAGAVPFDVSVTDVSDGIALIAVQGPRAQEILERTAGLEIVAGQASLAEVRYYRATAATFAERNVFIGRTGYTGEDGFELYADVRDAAALWSALTVAGAPLGLVPAGLACRDTLRLEAGMPLYGHELGADLLPVQAGLGRVVALTKDTDFPGRAAVEAGAPAGSRVLVGLVAEGRRAGRAGYAVLSADGEPVGEITSGALSPTLGHPIALAYVDPDSSTVGTSLAIDVRGSRIPATVTTPPFYSRKK